MNKIITTISAVLIFTASLCAQDIHELSVYGGAGLSELKYKPVVGKTSGGFGGDFGIGYKFFFHKNIGIGSGLELGFYNKNYRLDHLSSVYLAVDTDGEEFEFRSTLNNYRENQRSMYLNIPLMMQYRTGGAVKFYAALGGKVGFPLSVKYKATSALLTNSGYYDYENYEYTELDFLTLGKFDTQSKKESFDLKTAFMLSAEIGASKKLNDKLSLFAGAYFDYGLNDIRKDKSAQHLIPYTPGETAEINNLAGSYYIVDNSTIDASGKIIPLAVGLKVGLTFGFGKTKKQTSGISEQAVLEEKTEKAVAPQVEEVVEEVEVENVVEVAEEIDTVEVEETAEDIVEVAEETSDDKAIGTQVLQEEIEAVLDGYKVNESAVQEVHYELLNHRAELLNKYPDLCIVIEGHTCEQGTDDVNSVIGRMRSQAVSGYLQERGVDKARITLTSKGSSEPLIENLNPANRLTNRRVVIRLKD